MDQGGNVSALCWNIFSWSWDGVTVLGFCSTALHHTQWNAWRHRFWRESWFLLIGGKPEKNSRSQIETNHSPRTSPGSNPGHSGGRRTCITGLINPWTTWSLAVQTTFSFSLLLTGYCQNRWYGACGRSDPGSVIVPCNWGEAAVAITSRHDTSHHTSRYITSHYITSQYILVVLCYILCHGCEICFFTFFWFFFPTGPSDHCRVSCSHGRVACSVA